MSVETDVVLWVFVSDRWNLILVSHGSAHAHAMQLHFLYPSFVFLLRFPPPPRCQLINRDLSLDATYLNFLVWWQKNVVTSCVIKNHNSHSLKPGFGPVELSMVIPTKFVQVTCKWRAKSRCKICTCTRNAHLQSHEHNSWHLNNKWHISGKGGWWQLITVSDWH